MSLTSVLADPSSSLSVFLEHHFPAIPDLSCLIGTQVTDHAIPAIREHGRIIPWRTIGTAIDYRLRLAFTPDAAPKPPGQSPANPSATNAITAGMRYALIQAEYPARNSICGRAADLGLELISGFQALIAETAPFDPANPISLGGRLERDLCKLCYAGAWYDAFSRTGDLEEERNQELRYAASTSDDLDDMLTAIPDIAVANMMALIRHASTSEIAALRQHTAGTGLCIPGPCFPGSPDVDGADADLIAGDLLLEIKTHANPAKTACDTLRQLLGYLLLDYDDSYQLTQAGIYYTRHARLVRWTISDLLQALGCPEEVAGLRRRCAATLHSSGAEIGRGR
jgi:hypothetical protein